MLFFSLNGDLSLEDCSWRYMICMIAGLEVFKMDE